MTREELEIEMRVVRNGLRAAASLWDQRRAVDALHYVATVARAGIDAKVMPSVKDLIGTLVMADAAEEQFGGKSTESSGRGDKAE